MSIQDLGNIGEFVAAIATLATLIYLATQIRQNTKTLRSNIYSSWVDTSSHSQLIQTEHPGVFVKAFDPNVPRDDLSPEELRIFTAWCFHVCNLFEANYLHHIEGAYDEEAFEAKHRNMVWTLNQPKIRQFWESFSEHVYDRRFIDYVETEIFQDER